LAFCGHVQLKVVRHLFLPKENAENAEAQGKSPQGWTETQQVNYLLAARVRLELRELFIVSTLGSPCNMIQSPLRHQLSPEVVMRFSQVPTDLIWHFLKAHDL
jgi:hypothetical protein